MNKYNYKTIKANYHTHTTRCGHAVGMDREYVEAAIAAGLKILGFSDHSLYPTEKGFAGGERMKPEAVAEYFDSLTKLREEYKNDIEIHIGLEIEYYPEHFERLERYMKEYPLEYLILGQHYHSPEELIYVGMNFIDKKYLNTYVCNVVEGIKSGKFLYLAHPDLPQYKGPNRQETLEDVYHQICSAAKDCGMPLEINMNGYMKNPSPYPVDRFFQIAGEYGNQVIIGMDIHNPVHFGRTDALQSCFDLVEKYQLNLLETLDIKR